TAVVGLRDFYQRTRTGDQIIVDAERGEVILNPSAASIQRYEFTAQSSSSPLPYQSFERGPVVTEDGVSIALRANIELPTEFESVKRYGACGVGLFRSEFLLSRPGLLLSEDEQFEAYRALAEMAGPEGAVVRLFDLGGETGYELSERPERNPALGLRAIRFGLKNVSVMRAQVRAILRAASFGPLRIVIPMISDVADVRRAKQIIVEEWNALETEMSSKPGIGAMIEIPSAVLTADKIASEVDFFELGTNDLVQYTLAVDRGNDAVSDWFRTLHPAVLFGINRSLEIAREHNIPAIVCGEMASTPAYVVLLAGMGAVDLSMTPAAIPRVRSTLSQINTVEASELARQCLECATADEVEGLVRDEFARRWPNLFSPQTLPAESTTN